MQRVWKRWRLASSFLFITILVGLAGPGRAGECDLPEIRTGEAPTPIGTPVPINASFVVADIMGVDDVNQQIEIDLIARFEWIDPRLADFEGCRFGVTDVWVPQVRLANSSNLRLAFRNARDQVIVGQDGHVTYIQRGTGNISSYHSLRRFPFDHHDFKLHFTHEEILGSGYTLQFIADKDQTWLANRLNIEGWTVEGIGLETGSLTLREDGEAFNVVTLSIQADRDPEFYIYRVMLLLFLVVGMSWVIFWVPPSQFEFQIGIGATSMLTAIAFNLAVTSRLPPVGYLTTLDKMIVWAILLVFLSIIEALLAGRLVMAKMETAAIRVDRACRVLFPVLLVGGWAWSDPEQLNGNK